MKLKPSRLIQLERKADQGCIWLEPWSLNLEKIGRFCLVQIFKIRSKFSKIRSNLSKAGKKNKRIRNLVTASTSSSRFPVPDMSSTPPPLPFPNPCRIGTNPSASRCFPLLRSLRPPPASRSPEPSPAVRPGVSRRLPGRPCPSRSLSSSTRPGRPSAPSPSQISAPSSDIRYGARPILPYWSVRLW
jgi:hypothetical protein